MAGLASAPSSPPMPLPEFTIPPPELPPLRVDFFTPPPPPPLIPDPPLVLTPPPTLTTQPNLVINETIFVPEIAPGEGVPVARLIMDSNISYTITVTAEGGDESRIFTGLRDQYEQNAPLSGRQWSYLSLNQSREPGVPHVATKPFPDIPWELTALEGIYYLYIGSSDSRLTGVEVNVAG